MIRRDVLFIDRMPKASRPDRVAVAVERWRERLVDAPAEDRARIDEALADPAAHALLTAIFGNSPFLTECWLKEPAFSARLLAEGPDASFAEALAGVKDDLVASAKPEEVAKALRAAKRRAALTIAAADLSGAWDLTRITGALTELADRALDLSAATALATQLRRAGQPMVPPDALRRGLICLGMGKLGARELNYSSDIDIILLYDLSRAAPEIQAACAAKSAKEFYVRAARDIVALMDERNADGYVFRTDLRLRPDPGSTPLALSVEAAETYYESVGQNWERAAMIKARPCAGDIEAGHAFLRRLRPFIWRKHLDFAAIQDVHSIKRQINAHKGGATVQALGHNVKIGRGGIREIEFFAQTQQLIWGGRDPSVRVSDTASALRALAAGDRIKSATAEQLIDDYGYLRMVEHRLQMVEDQQTQTLPADREKFDQIGVFCGHDDGPAFESHLLTVLRRVESRYAELFEEAPSLSKDGNLMFTGKVDDPATLETLRGLGYADPVAVSGVIRGWHHGRIRATRSARARELLTEMIPSLLAALGETNDPNAAFARLDGFLTALPAGVQLLSLLHANPPLLALLGEVMGAPGLAGVLSRRPALLDAALFDPDAAGPDSAAWAESDLARALRQAGDYQDALDITRRWTADQRFLIGVAGLRGALGSEEICRRLSFTADAGVAAMLRATEAEFAARHGRVAGGGFAALGFGKLGSQELSPTSDLDLVFIYDHDPAAEASDGDKPLPPNLYFQRLGQRLISALTAPTAEGELYQVDMRLRPHGDKGSIASRLDYFRRYYDEEAWTWEHLALVRARPVAAIGGAEMGAEGMAARVEATLAAILATPRDRAAVLADVAAMRGRLLRDKPGQAPWEIKRARGGLIDAEFLAQALMLVTPAAQAGDPAARPRDCAGLLTRLVERGALPAVDAAELMEAHALLGAVQTQRRLTGVETPPVPITASVADTAALLTQVQSRVAAAFDRYIGVPATPGE